MRKFYRLVPAVVAAALIATAVPGVVTAADPTPKHPGDQPTETMFLERKDGDHVLLKAVDTRKSANSDRVSFDLRRKNVNPTQYQVLATWDTAPAFEPTRLVDIGSADIWVRTLSGDEDSDAPNDNVQAQFLLEVLRSGQPVASVETGCVALSKRPTAASSFDIPAPPPSTDLSTGDVLSLRASARLGSGVGCGGATRGTVRLEYGSSDRPSKIGFQFGEAGPTTSTRYLDKIGGKYQVLDVVPDTSKAENYEAASFSLKRKNADPNLYQVLGTWSAPAVTKATRVVNVGSADLWLRTPGREEDQDWEPTNEESLNVQLLLEVLKNGQVGDAAETGCVTLQSAAARHKVYSQHPPRRPASATSFDLPAPLPAIELSAGDVLAFRVSVRLGAALGCGGRTNGRVRLDYGSIDKQSKIDFGLGGGSGPAASTLQFVNGPGQAGRAFVVVNGRIYITPLTVITSEIFNALTLDSCAATLTFPGGFVAPFPCAAGPFRIAGIPSSAPALGLYKLDLAVVPTGGTLRSEHAEFYSVDTLP